jgi:hypothetical protein
MTSLVQHDFLRIHLYTELNTSPGGPTFHGAPIDQHFSVELKNGVTKFAYGDAISDEIAAEENRDGKGNYRRRPRKQGVVPASRAMPMWDALITAFENDRDLKTTESECNRVSMYMEDVQIELAKGQSERHCEKLSLYSHRGNSDFEKLFNQYFDMYWKP